MFQPKAAAECATSTATDTFGTVVTATAALTTSNGIAVAVGDQYVTFPDGTTWASSAVATGHTQITSIDLAPTANPNEFTVSIDWLDQTGSSFTTTDPTPITVSAPALSADIGQTLVSSSGDGNFYAMPVTDIACYEISPLISLSNTNEAQTGVAGSTNVYVVWECTADIEIDTIGIVLDIPNTVGQVPIGNMDIRSGATSTGPILASSTNNPIAVHGYITNAGATTNYTFAPGTVLTAGQKYSFDITGITAQQRYALYPNDTTSAILFDGTLIVHSSFDPGISVTGTDPAIPIATQFDVITYSDGTLTKVIASEVGVPTDIQDVTAGMPATWTECVDAAAIAPTTDTDTFSTLTDNGDRSFTHTSADGITTFTIDPLEPYRHAITPGDFVLDGDGFMSLSIPQTIHGLPVSSSYAVSAYTIVGGFSDLVTLDHIRINIATGDVVISVPLGDEFDGELTLV